MNQRKAGAMLSYVLIGVSAIVNFIYVPVLLHYLGTNEYGLYRLMGSIVIYFGLMDFGMSSATIRFYVKYRTLGRTREMENVLAFSSIIYGAIILGIIGLGAVFYSWMDTIFSSSFSVKELESARQIFILVLFNLVLTFVGQIFTAVITAHEKFVFLKSLALLQVIVQPFAIIAVIQFSPNAYSLVVVQSICNFLLILGRGIFALCRLKVRIHYHFMDKAMLKEIGSFSAGLFAVAMTDQIFWQGNQVILGIVGGTAVVAVYAIASQIYLNYITLSSVVIGVYLPKITEMVANCVPEKEFSRLFIRIGRIQFFILAAILSGFILFGQEFISLWAGNEFSEAYWIALVIMIPFSVNLIQSIALIILQAKNQYGFRARVHVFIGALNVLVAIPFAMEYGALGCACVTGFLNFIDEGIIMNVYFAKIMKLDVKEFWMQIARTGSVILLCMPIGVALNYLVMFTPLLDFVIKVLLYGLIYVVMVWNLACNAYERNLALQGIQMLREKPM